MAGYIGSKASVTQVDGYNRSEADAEFVQVTGDTMTGALAVDGNLTVDTNTLFVDAANNRVGIGTSFPSDKLDVRFSTNGYIFASNSADANTGIRFQNTGRDYAIFCDGGAGASNSLRFYDFTAAAERARIDASGNLLVGTTSAVGSNASKISVLYDGTALWGAAFKASSAAGNDLVFVNASGTTVGAISHDASSTSYATSSDYRLKEDVQPMVGATDRLMALKPVNFAWKADGSRVDGFLAHEAQEVVPEAVTGEKDKTEIVEIKDEDGNVTGTEERPVYQGIDQSKLVPLLTATLQDALTKIEQLEARMAILEGGAA